MTYPKNYMCQIHNLNDIYMDVFGYREFGFFVDVGAFDGVQWSNTWNLALASWSGIAIEPNPDHFKRLRENYIANPRVATIEAAIADVNGSTELYLGGSLTTIVPKTVELYNDTTWGKFSGLDLENSITVKTYTLDSIFRTFNLKPYQVDVLSIDVEGAEIKVLKGFSIGKYRPRLVIVETHEANEDKRLARKSRYVNAYMSKHGYDKIQADSINSIYVRP